MTPAFFTRNVGFAGFDIVRGNERRNFPTGSYLSELPRSLLQLSSHRQLLNAATQQLGQRAAENSGMKVRRGLAQPDFEKDDISLFSSVANGL
jgi:hypothetical protein